MMNIKNPTEADVTINFKGEDFTVAAGKSEKLPEEVVKHWVAIHSFMLVSDNKADNDDEKKEVKKEVKEVEATEKKKVAKK